MVICLERGADVHVAQQMPLSLTVSCFSKIQIGFTFLVPAYLGSPGQRAVKWVCVCMPICYFDVGVFYCNCILKLCNDAIDLAIRKGLQENTFFWQPVTVQVIFFSLLFSLVAIVSKIFEMSGSVTEVLLN